MLQKCKSILLIGILIIIAITNAIACSCEGELSVSASVKYSDVIFSGQVLSKFITDKYDSIGVKASGDSSNYGFNWRKSPSLVVNLKVDRMYKGQKVSDTITILTAPNESGCGFEFKVGKNYIVYATLYSSLVFDQDLKLRTYDNKTFWTHLFTRTQEWNLEEEAKLFLAID